MSEENNIIELKIERAKEQKPDPFQAAQKHVTSPLYKSLGKFSALSKGKLTIKDILK